MDGLTLIREARNAGLHVAAAGDKLVIRGPRQAEPIVRKLIEHKPVVLAILREPIAEPVPINATVGDDAMDWRELFEERAAMRQYCGGYRRNLAERLAYGECIERWCELNPVSHRPGLCAGCGAPLGNNVLELCDGARVHWERHRAFECLIAYGEERTRTSAPSC